MTKQYKKAPRLRTVEEQQLWKKVAVAVSGCCNTINESTPIKWADNVVEAYRARKEKEDD